MYGNQINDSALKYLQKELTEASKNNEKGLVILFVICFISFIVNASISTLTQIYLFKSHFIGLIKFILNKIAQSGKNTKKDIPLVEIKDDGKYNDTLQNVALKDKKDELLSEKKQNFITFACYIYVLIVAIYFDKIINEINSVYAKLTSTTREKLYYIIYNSLR